MGLGSRISQLIRLLRYAKSVNCELRCEQGRIVVSYLLGTSINCLEAHSQ